MRERTLINGRVPVDVFCGDGNAISVYPLWKSSLTTYQRKKSTDTRKTKNNKEVETKRDVVFDPKSIVLSAQLNVLVCSFRRKKTLFTIFFLFISLSFRCWKMKSALSAKINIQHEK